MLKEASQYLKNDLKELGVEIVEHSIVPDGVDDRKTLQQLLRGIEAQRLILGIKKPDGSLVQHPESSYRLEANDVVMMLSSSKAS
jgi:Trk K+ transport system NAD-binding subunit